MLTSTKPRIHIFGSNNYEKNLGWKEIWRQIWQAAAPFFGRHFPRIPSSADRTHCCYKITGLGQNIPQYILLQGLQYCVDEPGILEASICVRPQTPSSLASASMETTSTSRATRATSVFHTHRSARPAGPATRTSRTPNRDPTSHRRAYQPGNNNPVSSDAAEVVGRGAIGM